MDNITQPFGSCRVPNCRTPPTPGFADRGLCYHCETAGRDAVAAIAADWLALQPLIWQKPVIGLREAIGRPTFGPTEPVHLSTDELARTLAYVALLWEEPVRDRARLHTPNPHQSEAAHVARACLTLITHFTVLLALPPTPYYPTLDATTPTEGDGPDAVTTILTLHRRARARIGLTEATESLPTPCHLCHWPQLRHKIGADDVYCPRCHTTWPWSTWHAAQEAALFGGAA